MKESMTKTRTLCIPFLIEQKKGYTVPELAQTGSLWRYSYSDLAGHGSFLCLALSYLDSDLMYLRIYAMSGISLSIIFQYYREIPLWIPIRWNSLFFTINLFMLMLMIKEENNAQQIPEEQRVMYQQIFHPKGMKAVDFLHLMSNSTRRCLVKGEKIISQDVAHDRVYFVQSGRLTVYIKKNGQPAYNTPNYVVNQSQFVGLRSFLAWEDEKCTRQSTRSQSFLEQQRSYLENSLYVAVNKLLQFENLDTHSKANNDETKYLNDNGHLGYADVISEEDCVVYSWTFRSLHYLLATEPTLGLVMEKIISADLSRKIAGSVAREPKLHYEDLLRAIAVNSEITPTQRALLKKFRMANDISDDEHERLINTFGWSKSEFNVGYHGAPSPLIIHSYEKMLSEKLKAQKLSHKDKEELCQYRDLHNISAEVHLFFLHANYWSFNEYERGEKETNTKGS